MRNNILFVSFQSQISIVFDKEPEFDIVVLRYGNKIDFPVPNYVTEIIDVESECKGDLMLHCFKYLQSNNKYDFVAIYDDDITTKISQLEHCFEIADRNGLDLFQPSLTHDSHHSHEFTLNKGYRVTPCPWVEVMCPGFSKRFLDYGLDAMVDLIEKNNFKSGWGLDVYVFARIIQNLDGKAGVIHQEIIKHHRAITSSGRVFSNGKSAHQEMEDINEIIKTEEFWNPKIERKDGDLNIGKIYYINLDKRIDRRASMERGLKIVSAKTGIPYERVSAIAPLKCDYEDPPGKYYHLRERMSPRVHWSTNGKNLRRALGMLGCYLTHVQLYQKIYDEGHEYAIVMEDDYMITTQTIRHINREFKQGFPDDWWLLRDGWFLKHHKYYKHTTPNFVSRHAVENPSLIPHRNFGGTHFIILNVKKIPELLKCLEYEYIMDIDGALNSPPINNYFFKLEGSYSMDAGSDIPKTDIK